MYGKQAIAGSRGLHRLKATVEAYSGMPFAGPEAALRATISPATTLRVVFEK
jgi:hypothetical protein